MPSCCRLFRRCYRVQISQSHRLIFRAMKCIASALLVPSSIPIISKPVESEKPRNFGIDSLGLANPLRFPFGMVLGGVFVGDPGWRVGYYIAGAMSFLLFIIGIRAIPAGIKRDSAASISKKLAKEIDWIGACIANTPLTLFSFVLA